jgi:hypothetical protein
VHVEAPAATAGNPLVVRLLVDGALFDVAGVPTGLKVIHDGLPTTPCTGPAGQASPDPCVQTRILVGADQVRFTVLSSAGGEWNFGVPVTVSPLVRCLSGAELLMQQRPRRLQLVSRDTSQLVLGDAADIPALITQGGSLRITAVGGDGFDTIYPLPAAGWRLLHPQRPQDGIRYRAPRGPITSVVLRAGRLLVVKGKGPQLAQSLGTDPAAVQVELEVGALQYSLEFDSSIPRQFQSNRRLLRRGASPPAACTAGNL